MSLLDAVKFILLVLGCLIVAFISVFISVIFVALVVDLLGGAYDAFN